jgi:YkoY family integral membrane protein
MLDQLLEYSPNLGVDTLLLLPVLVALEAVLSADNAIALAAIAQGLNGHDQQRRALNFGLVIAFCLRVALILTATWVLRFWQFELLGAAYLLWLVYQHFAPENELESDSAVDSASGEHHHKPRFASLWQAIPMIAFTDLAFSLDSVTTAIAISRETWLIITGGMIGVITLRFMAGLFIRWLDEFEHLEDAGFITVAFVGLRLLLRVINPEFVPPEWLMVILIAAVFAWGFSKRTEQPEKDPETSTTLPDASTKAFEANSFETNSFETNSTTVEVKKPQEVSAD